MYQYHVKWWYDDKTIDNYGLVAADTFKEAAEKVSENYGDRDIEELSLEILSDTEDILQYKDEVKDLKKYFEL